MLHLPSGIALRMDVADLLQLEGTFQGNGVIDAAAEVDDCASVSKSVRQL